MSSTSTCGRSQSRELQNPTGVYEDDHEGFDNVQASKVNAPTGNAESTALRRLRHERFEEFARARPLRGLGVDVGLVRRAVANDRSVRDALDRELQNAAGRPPANETVDNVNGFERPTGNATDAALRRLRKEAEAGNAEVAGLRDEVLAGRLSAHQAMVRAGFRPKTLTVPVDRPESIARLAECEVLAREIVTGSA